MFWICVIWTKQNVREHNMYCYSYSFRNKESSGIQIWLQHNVNKTVDQGGWAKHPGILLIGCSFLSLTPTWKIFGYKAVHMDKKNTHTRVRSGYTWSELQTKTRTPCTSIIVHVFLCQCQSREKKCSINIMLFLQYKCIVFKVTAVTLWQRLYGRLSYLTKCSSYDKRL